MLLLFIHNIYALFEFLIITNVSMLIVCLVTLMLVFSLFMTWKIQIYFSFFLSKTIFSKHYLYFETGLCDPSSPVVMCQLQK